MNLRERWHDLVPDADELVDQLAGRYSDERRRAYRDRYLATALDAADDLIQLATDPVAVRLAVWFHRAAHADGAGPAEDAEASARLAAELLPRYGVGATRVAEVERLVRLTGSFESAADDPNGDVVHDAVMAITASAPATYQNHSSEVRRATGDRERYAERRHREISRSLSAGVFRTPLARDRMDSRARANLEQERDLADEVIPAPWRGWQVAALRALALFGTLAATLLAVAGSRSPWSEPTGDEAPGGVTVLLGLAGLALAAVLHQLTGRPGRRAATGIAAAGLVALLVCVLRMPVVNPANGIGLRVPAFLAAAALLVLSAGAAVAAGLLQARTRRHVPERNRGQVLAWLGTAAVIVLLVYVAEPLARSYVLNRDEHVTGSGTPGQPAPASAVDGSVLWSSRTHLTDAVATKNGIAVPDPSGGVLMLDGRTGEQRWNYQRSDVRGELPKLYALDGGAALLVRWDEVADEAGDLVLDAATGHRIAVWPSGSRDEHDDLQSVDPLVTSQSVSEGSDMLRGTDVDGHARWTYKPGRCFTISAEATESAVVTRLSGGCGDPDRVVGLDLHDGKELWSQDRAGLQFGPVAAGDVVVLTEGTKGSAQLGEFQAVDPRSGNEVWRAPAPSGNCRRPVYAGGALVLTCDTTEHQTRFVAVDAATGRTAWQHETSQIEADRSSVTTSGRVVVRAIGGGRGCKVFSVDRTGVRTVEVRAPEITADNYCRSTVHALGDLVVVETDEGAVALR